MDTKERSSFLNASNDSALADDATQLVDDIDSTESDKENIPPEGEPANLVRSDMN